MNKISVLATGLTGLVGSRIQEILGNKYEFKNIDLTTGVDITDKGQVSEFIQKNPASVMIHLAAFTNVRAAFEQTNDKSGICYQVNVEGTKNIVQVCQENQIYLIHFSTDFVFAGNQEEPYTEEDGRHPIEWYGQTKAWAEEAIEETLKNYAIVRIGYPFRAQCPNKPGMVTKIRQSLEDGSLYPQFTDMIITPTYIDDVARVMDKMIEAKPTGIYHLHSSTSLSPFELTQKIARTFSFDPDSIKEGRLDEYLQTTNRPYQKTLRMSNDKVQAELGVKLMTIDEALADIKNQLD